MIGGGGTVEPPKPQYYQVACSEGHVIRGERTEGYQALRCPHCGEGVFVLPRSPLPLPPVPASSRKKPAQRQLSASELGIEESVELTNAPPQEELEEIQWIDPEVMTAAPAVPKPRPRVPIAVERPSTDPRPADAGEPPPVIPSRPISKRPRPAARPPSEVGPAAEPSDSLSSNVDPTPGRIAVHVKSRTPWRMIAVMAVVAVMTVATVSYRTWRAQLQELPHEAESNALEGKEALESGRFDEAKLKLGRAAVAYRRLNATDENALEAFQLADEAEILSDLGRSELREIVEDIARRSDVDGQAKFEALHRGRTVLVDSTVDAVSSDGVELKYRIFVGRGPSPSKVGRIDLAGFRLMKDKGLKPSDRVVFGAKLDSIRLDGGEWRIHLEPTSGVWMTNAKALAIGFQEASPP